MAFDDILNSVYSKAAGFNPGGNMSLLVPSNCFAPNPELGTWPQKTPARQKLFPGGSEWEKSEFILSVCFTCGFQQYKKLMKKCLY